jgi:hypothetical protein
MRTAPRRAFALAAASLAATLTVPLLGLAPAYAAQTLTATVSASPDPARNTVTISGTVDDPNGEPRDVTITLSDGGVNPNIVDTFELPSGTTSYSRVEDISSLHVYTGVDVSVAALGNVTGDTSNTAQTSFLRDADAPAGVVHIDSPVTAAAQTAAQVTVERTDMDNGNADVAVSVCDQDGLCTGVQNTVLAGNGSTDTFSFDVSGLAEGPITAVAVYADALGNSSQVTDVGQKNAVGPTITGLTAAPDPTAGYLSVSGTTEPNSSVAISVDDGTNPPVTVTTGADGVGGFDTAVDVSGLDDGPLTVTATATDTGNATGASAQTTVTKDATGPTGTVTIDTDPVNDANQNNVQVTVAPADTDATGALVNLCDNAQAQQCTGPQALVFDGQGSPVLVTFDASGLADGTLTATATFDDQAGNTGQATDTAAKDTQVAGTVDIVTDTETAANHESVAVEVTSAEDAGYSLVLCDDNAVCTGQHVGTLTGGQTGTVQVDASGLADGTLTATVTFTDPAGNTSTATDTAAKDTTTVPSAPQNVNAAQTDADEVTVTWAAPATAGTSPVDDYKVTLTDGNAYTDTVYLDPTELSYAFDGLAVATYTATVVAETGDGNSPAGTDTVTVVDPPGAPQNVTVTSASPNTITVTWDAPAGGTQVDGYQAGYGNGGSGDGENVGPGVRSHTFTNIPAGSYTAGVSAFSNAAGWGQGVYQPVAVSNPPAVVVVPVPEPSSTPSATPTPTPTATPTATPSETPTATPSEAPKACTRPSVQILGSEIAWGASSRALVSGTPGDRVRIDAYSRPNTTYTTVRGYQTVPASGLLAYTFTPGSNTRVFAVSENCGGGGTGTISVHLTVGISARRDEPLEYTFSGRVSPAAVNEGRQVSLFYTGKTGQPVLKGRGYVHDGIVSVTVTFTGAGQEDFFFASGDNLVSLDGRSTDRSTVLH